MKLFKPVNSVDQLILRLVIFNIIEILFFRFLLNYSWVFIFLFLIMSMGYEIIKFYYKKSKV